MNRQLPDCLCLIAVTLLSGCQTEHHRWQTVVNEDGSVERTISRPTSGTPDGAEAAVNWDTRRFHKDMDRTVWPERITQARIDSAKPEHEKELDYFVARGEFASLDKVPQHYRFELEGTELVSELKHNLIIYDYGLVKEYLWSEAITDVVKFEDIPAARRETIELITAIVEEGLQNGLGDEYDVSGLIEWIRNEGDKMLEEFTLLLLDSSFRSLDQDAREQRLDEFLSKWGISEASDKALKEFVRKRLREGIKQKDGQPVKEAVIEMILEGSEVEGPSDVQTALEEAVRKRLGEKEEANAKMAALCARQVGLHGVPLLNGPQEFDVWLKLPGEVIETNGVLDEEGFLRWSFDRDDIWPTGYQMTARSVIPVRVRNSQVLRKEKLGLRDEMLAFLKLMKDDDELNETVQLCLAQNTLSPLETLEKLRRNDAGNPPADVQVTTDEQANWKRARQLLDLLNQDPPATAN